MWRRRCLVPRNGACALLLAWALLATGCAELPRDQTGWTERIRQSGEFPVGVSGDSSGHGLMETREKELVEKIAGRLGARVVWRRGNAHALLDDLAERRIPLVAATLPSDSPFAERIGLSKPYLKRGPQGKDYCLAVAPGENRLLLLVDTIIAEDTR